MLVIEALNKSYIDAGKKHQILKNTHLRLEQGQSVSIVGESGSGKSTLLHLIGGLDKADSGKILLCTDNHSTNNNRNNKNSPFDNIAEFDEKQADIYRKRDLGLIFQKYNLIDCISVLDNVLLPAQLNKNVNHAYIQTLLDALGISSLQHKLPSDLSGGEQQRVAIARALSHQPKLVLADEPTGNLDANNSAKVSRLLVDSCKSFNASLVLVTHSQEVAKLTDCQKTLRQGSLEDNINKAPLLTNTQQSEPDKNGE